MSKLDFSLNEFRVRRAKVRSGMAEKGLDWLIVIHPGSIHWLTGSDAKSFQAFQCLFFALDQRPSVMLTRLAEQPEFEADALVDEVRGWGGREPEDPLHAFEKLAEELGLKQARVGMEVPAYYLHPYHYVGIRDILANALADEPCTLIQKLKLVKSEREISYTRAAAGIADKAMRSLARGLAEGISELELSAIVHETLFRCGSGIPASSLNLVSGERSAFAHGAPTERRLTSGDAGNAEFGAAFRRYTATIGRQFSLGRPSQRMAEVYAVALEASDHCIDAIRAGVSAEKPHEAARKVIEAAGLEQYRVHLSGYGIAPGFPPSWGEPLQMDRASSDILEEGMIVSVEPPVYIAEEQIGVRIVDNVLVTATGAELLSRYHRHIVQID